MIDLPDVLARKLRDHGYDAKTRKLADISKGGIAVRRIPSTTIARNYDGTREIAYLTQVVVSREDEMVAIDEIEAITELVPTLDLASDNGSYKLTSTEVYTDPNELQTGVWEVRFRSLITTKG